MPILPLDGGRLLNNLAYSFGTGVGAVAVFGSLVFGGLVAYLANLQLLVLMVMIGLINVVVFSRWRVCVSTCLRACVFTCLRV